MANKIKIDETALRGMVAESLRRILKEYRNKPVMVFNKYPDFIHDCKNMAYRLRGWQAKMDDPEWSDELKEKLFSEFMTAIDALEQLGLREYEEGERMEAENNNY